MSEHDYLVTQVGRDLALLNGRLQELNMPAWLRLDLTMAQLRTLIVVCRHPGTTVGEVGASLSICQSASSLLVDHLVRRELVKRSEDPSDRRRALLVCTPAGEAQLADLRRGNEQVFTEWLGALPEEELDALARGLRAVARVAGIPEPEVWQATTDERA